MLVSTLHQSLHLMWPDRHSMMSSNLLVSFRKWSLKVNRKSWYQVCCAVLQRPGTCFRYTNFMQGRKVRCSVATRHGVLYQVGSVPTQHRLGTWHCCGHPENVLTEKLRSLQMYVDAGRVLGAFHVAIGGRAQKSLHDDVDGEHCAATSGADAHEECACVQYWGRPYVQDWTC